MSLELERKGKTARVVKDGRVIGEIRQIKPNDFTYTSNEALGPYRHGRCISERAALAHLGYKPKSPKQPGEPNE